MNYAEITDHTWRRVGAHSRSEAGQRNVLKGTRCPLVVEHKTSKPVDKTQASNIRCQK